MGRDQFYQETTKNYSGFNPRARMGRDIILSRLSIVLTVSIHAPAWGATHAPFSSSRKRRCFNPRARMGRDNGFFISN